MSTLDQKRTMAHRLLWESLQCRDDSDAVIIAANAKLATAQAILGPHETTRLIAVMVRRARSRATSPKKVHIERA